MRDPRQGPPAEAARIARETPPIGWINFGTDGNETSAFECSMQLAYLIDVPPGDGHVVLFANDPAWRAFWIDLDRLFPAAILFSKAT